MEEGSSEAMALLFKSSLSCSAVAASFPITMQMVWHTAIQKVGDKALTFVAENYCVWLGLSLTEKLNKNQTKKEYPLCPKIELPMM